MNKCVTMSESTSVTMNESTSVEMPMASNTENQSTGVVTNVSADQNQDQNERNDTETRINEANENMGKESSPPIENINEGETIEKTEKMDNSSSNSASASPEPNCPICLGKMENKSFTNSCFHQFCFTCLLEWSKTKAQCPLCKQPFKSIVHSVRSDEDYDQYDLTFEDLHRQNLASRHLRRYRIPDVRIVSYVRNNRSNASRENSFAPHHFVRNQRRYFYDNRRWVLPASRSTPVRRADASFYSSNPATTHRLVPWLNRELVALSCGNRIAFILELILSLLGRYEIQSPEFAEQLMPYLGEHTRQFVHEFYHFARSPYDMAAYDRVAVYPNSNLASNENSDDSDIEVLNEIEVPMANREGRPRWSHYAQLNIANAMVSRARHFLQFINEESNFMQQPITNSSMVSPQPGPSGLSNNIVHDIHSSSDEEQDARSTVIKLESNSNVDNDNDIVLLSPPRRQTPELITLSDDESPNVDFSSKPSSSGASSPKPSTSETNTIPPFRIKTRSVIVKPNYTNFSDSDYSDLSSQSDSSQSTILSNNSLNEIKTSKIVKHSKKKRHHSESESDTNDSTYNSRKKHKRKSSKKHHHKNKSKSKSKSKKSK